ncbi:MAG: DUF3786 domain-containing protein [Candidatus Heimdallarchaeota archaeon]
MDSKSNSHTQILEHWARIARTQPWILSPNHLDLWNGVFHKKPVQWRSDGFGFLGFQLNFQEQRCWDALSKKYIQDPHPLLRILAYLANGLPIQPIPARLKWIRLAHFPGLKGRTCAVSEWPELIATLKGEIASRKIDFRSILSSPRVALEWSFQEIFQRSTSFWKRALAPVKGAACSDGPGDLLWEVTVVPNVVVRVVFQEPDLDDSFMGSATIFFSGESIYFLPVEIAESVPRLVVGRCLQAAGDEKKSLSDP